MAEPCSKKSRKMPPKTSQPATTMVWVNFDGFHRDFMGFLIGFNEQLEMLVDD